MTMFSVSPVRVSALSLGTLALALARLRAGRLALDFDFSTLRFAEAEVLGDLTARPDAS